MERETNKQPLEIDIIIPESFFEQPYFYAKLGKRVLKVCPDPGATTSWFIQDLCVHNQQKECDDGQWDSITGFNIESDSVQFRELPLEHTDIMHDGFSGSAKWVEEALQMCAGDGSAQQENAKVLQSLLIPRFKMRMMTGFKETVCGVYHQMNYDGLIGLGMARGHLIASNWLLRACLEGMNPYFSYQCGLPFLKSPKLVFGGKLPECEGYVKKYYKITPENDLHDEGQGSHWYLGVKAIKWKCIGEEEQIIDEKNFTYKEKWKNTKPDKTFCGRSWSRSWFDMGYPTIVFPSTFGNSDCHQIQKFMSDMKAGNFGVFAGTIAPDVLLEEVKIEYVSLVFRDNCNENGLAVESDNVKFEQWTFTLDDVLTKDGKRKMEIEIENRNIDRKCIIVGLPFAKKFSLEYHFNPSEYSEECKHIVGIDMLGFQQPVG